MCLIQTALFTFDLKNNNLPNIFKDYLKSRIQNNNIITRTNQKNYYQEFTGSKFANACIKSAAVNAWLKVPNNLKDVNRKHIFKKHLQKYIINKYTLAP